LAQGAMLIYKFGHSVCVFNVHPSHAVNIRTAKLIMNPCTAELQVHCSLPPLSVPQRQPHRRSGLATLPSVGAVP